MNFTTDIQVRFSDFDALGHINNLSYLAYCDLGKAMYFIDRLGEYSIRAVSAAIVHIESDFSAPTLMGEPLRVDTRPLRMSERSLTLEQMVYNPDTGIVKCRVLTVMAGMDLATQTSAPLTDRLRAAIAPDL